MDISYLGITHPEFPWCRGTFENRSIPVSVITELKPIIMNGNMTLDSTSVNGIKIPEDGIYAFYVKAGGLSINKFILERTVYGGTYIMGAQDVVIRDDNMAVPSLCIVNHFSKGGLFTYTYALNVASTTITWMDAGYNMAFFFGRIA